MPYSKNSFVVPPLLTVDGIQQIAPRTRLAAGHLVYIRYERRSSNASVTLPRFTGGTYLLAKVIGQVEGDNSLVRVRVVAAPASSYQTSREMGNEHVAPKRCCHLLHPDPEWYYRNGQACPVLLSEGLSGYSPLNIHSIISTGYSRANSKMREKAVSRLEAKINEWNGDVESGREGMIRRCLNNFYGREEKRSARAKERLGQWITGRKTRGENLAKVISVLKKDPTPENFNTFKMTVDNFYNNGNLHQSSRDKLQEVATALMREFNYFYFGRCGHWHSHGHVVSYQGDISQLSDAAVHMNSVCIDCFMTDLDMGRIVEATTSDGNGTFVANLRYTSLHEWSDGTRRPSAEPPIIGGYHTSKDYLRNPLPHADGRKASDFWPYVGYELEFVRVEDGGQKSTEWIARKMQQRIAQAVANAKLGTQKYSCFERDASVEFELVSGYGPLDIHRAVITEMLSDGEMAKYVRSHDGGRCGLHVHVDKPSSLIHAIRMTAFYHSNENKRLIKTVARRYSAGNGYAKVVPDKGNSALAKEVWKRAKRDYPYDVDKSYRKARAISLINSDRYEMVNWHNANTAEIRAFRGSLRHETVIACLEFAYLVWHFTKDYPAQYLTESKFLQFIGYPQWRSESAYLRGYLKGKGFDVWMPNPNPSVGVAPINDDLVCEV